MSTSRPPSPPPPPPPRPPPPPAKPPARPSGDMPPPPPPRPPPYPPSATQVAAAQSIPSSTVGNDSEAARAEAAAKALRKEEKARKKREAEAAAAALRLEQERTDALAREEAARLAEARQRQQHQQQQQQETEQARIKLEAEQAEAARREQEAHALAQMAEAEAEAQAVAIAHAAEAARKRAEGQALVLAQQQAAKEEAERRRQAQLEEERRQRLAAEEAERRRKAEVEEAYRRQQAEAAEAARREAELARAPVTFKTAVPPPPAFVRVVVQLGVELGGGQIITRRFVSDSIDSVRLEARTTVQQKNTTAASLPLPSTWMLYRNHASFTQPLHKRPAIIMGTRLEQLLTTEPKVMYKPPPSESGEPSDEPAIPVLELLLSSLGDTGPVAFVHFQLARDSDSGASTTLPQKLPQLPTPFFLASDANSSGNTKDNNCDVTLAPFTPSSEWAVIASVGVGVLLRHEESGLYLSIQLKNKNHHARGMSLFDDPTTLSEGIGHTTKSGGTIALALSAVPNELSKWIFTATDSIDNHTGRPKSNSSATNSPAKPPSLNTSFSATNLGNPDRTYYLQSAALLDSALSSTTALFLSSESTITNTTQSSTIVLCCQTSAKYALQFEICPPILVGWMKKRTGGARFAQERFFILWGHRLGYFEESFEPYRNVNAEKMNGNNRDKLSSPNDRMKSTPSTPSTPSHHSHNSNSSGSAWGSTIPFHQLKRVYPLKALQKLEVENSSENSLTIKLTFPDSTAPSGQYQLQLEIKNQTARANTTGGGVNGAGTATNNALNTSAASSSDLFLLSAPVMKGLVLKGDVWRTAFSNILDVMPPIPEPFFSGSSWTNFYNPMASPMNRKNSLGLPYAITPDSSIIHAPSVMPGNSIKGLQTAAPSVAVSRENSQRNTIGAGEKRAHRYNTGPDDSPDPLNNLHFGFDDEDDDEDASPQMKMKTLALGGGRTTLPDGRILHFEDDTPAFQKRRLHVEGVNDDSSNGPVSPQNGKSSAVGLLPKFNFANSGAAAGSNALPPTNHLSSASMDFHHGSNSGFHRRKRSRSVSAFGSIARDKDIERYLVQQSMRNMKYHISKMKEQQNQLMDNIATLNANERPFQTEEEKQQAVASIAQPTAATIAAATAVLAASSAPPPMMYDPKTRRLVPAPFPYAVTGAYYPLPAGSNNRTVQYQQLQQMQQIQYQQQHLLLQQQQQQMQQYQSEETPQSQVPMRPLPPLPTSPKSRGMPSYDAGAASPISASGGASSAVAADGMVQQQPQISVQAIAAVAAAAAASPTGATAFATMSLIPAPYPQALSHAYYPLPAGSPRSLQSISAVQSSDLEYHMEGSYSAQPEPVALEAHSGSSTPSDSSDFESYSQYQYDPEYAQQIYEAQDPAQAHHQQPEEPVQLRDTVIPSFLLAAPISPRQPAPFPQVVAGLPYYPQPKPSPSSVSYYAGRGAAPPLPGEEQHSYAASSSTDEFGLIPVPFAMSAMAAGPMVSAAAAAPTVSLIGAPITSSMAAPAAAAAVAPAAAVVAAPVEPPVPAVPTCGLCGLTTGALVAGASSQKLFFHGECLALLFPAAAAVASAITADQQAQQAAAEAAATPEKGAPPGPETATSSSAPFEVHGSSAEKDANNNGNANMNESIAPEPLATYPDGVSPVKPSPKEAKPAPFPAVNKHSYYPLPASTSTVIYPFPKPASAVPPTPAVAAAAIVAAARGESEALVLKQQLKEEQYLREQMQAEKQKLQLQLQKAVEESNQLRNQPPPAAVIAPVAAPISSAAAPSPVFASSSSSSSTPMIIPVPVPMVGGGSGSDSTDVAELRRQLKEQEFLRQEAELEQQRLQRQIRLNQVFAEGAASSPEVAAIVSPPTGAAAAGVGVASAASANDSADVVELKRQLAEERFLRHAAQSEQARIIRQHQLEKALEEDMANRAGKGAQPDQPLAIGSSPSGDAASTSLPPLLSSVQATRFVPPTLSSSSPASALISPASPQANSPPNANAGIGSQAAKSTGSSAPGASTAGAALATALSHQLANGSNVDPSAQLPAPMKPAPAGGVNTSKNATNSEPFSTETEGEIGGHMSYKSGPIAAYNAGGKSGADSSDGDMHFQFVAPTNTQREMDLLSEVDSLKSSNKQLEQQLQLVLTQAMLARELASASASPPAAASATGTTAAARLSISGLANTPLIRGVDAPAPAGGHRDSFSTTTANGGSGEKSIFHHSPNGKSALIGDGSPIITGPAARGSLLQAFQATTLPPPALGGQSPESAHQQAFNTPSLSAMSAVPQTPQSLNLSLSRETQDLLHRYLYPQHYERSASRASTPQMPGNMSPMSAALWTAVTSSLNPLSNNLLSALSESHRNVLFAIEKSFGTIPKQSHVTQLTIKQLQIEYLLQYIRDKEEEGKSKSPDAAGLNGESNDKKPLKPRTSSFSSNGRSRNHSEVEPESKGELQQ